jgi:prepilin-type N-terminal cleavage/methylation domain-containing protein
MTPVRRQRGFSLIEVMCAILVLGIGLAGLTEGIAGALRSTREARLQSAAILFAAGLLETLRAEGYLTDGVTEGDCGPGLAPHRWRQTIARTDLDGLHDVLVAIEDGRTGKTLCELRTLLFEPPTGSLPTESNPGATGTRQRRGSQRPR